jgi:cell wall-associated NlpC family hydrolase
MVRLLRIGVVLLAAGTMFLMTAACASAATRTVSTTAKQRVDAAAVAVRKLRAPYRTGAAGPRRFDCSGLVNFAFTSVGTPLAGRSSYELWNQQGVRIRRSALRRGDLVWTWDRSFGHVGIYLGGGRYVHAPGAGRRVEIAPLPSGRSFIGAVRP